MDDAEADTAGSLRILNQAGFPRSIRRIVVAVAGPGRGRASAACSISPIARAEMRYEEEKLYRGLHPMMGKRLHLWRLSNFNIERLPSR